MNNCKTWKETAEKAMGADQELAPTGENWPKNSYAGHRCVLRLLAQHGARKRLDIGTQ